MSNKHKDETKIDERPASQEVAAQAKNTAISSDVDFGEDSGQGIENIRRDEMVIPFLRVLQALSPQCQKGQPGYVKGAEPGLILNTASGEFYDGDEGLEFIPCYRDHNYPEWTPRLAGGGFHGIKAADDDEVLALRAKHGAYTKLPTDRGTELVETYYLYGIAMKRDIGLKFRTLVPFSSVQIKKYKSFLNRVDAIQYETAPGVYKKPPMFAHRWNLGTVAESNKKGQFFGWRLTMFERDKDGREAPFIKSLLPMSQPLYKEAKAFYDLCTGGGAKVDYGKNTANSEEEVPFES